MAKRSRRVDQHHPHSSGESSPPDGTRLDLVIAIALGLVAVLTAGSLYLNEKQEHKATVDFHRATHLLVDVEKVGATTPRGHALETASDREFQDAQDHQEKATRYTLIEVVLACSLFLLGVAGVTRQSRVKIGALSAAAVTFLIGIGLLVGA